MIFSLASALDVLGLCTASGIVVLGVEVFSGLNVSTYDQQVKDDPREESWTDYVHANNVLAEDFIRRNPASSTSECVLTTASLREFRELGKFRQRLK
jgi:hypothetical protein